MWHEIIFFLQDELRINMFTIQNQLQRVPRSAPDIHRMLRYYMTTIPKLHWNLVHLHIECEKKNWSRCKFDTSYLLVPVISPTQKQPSVYD